MSKEIFKVGDRVFHLQYGWGIVKPKLENEPSEIYCVDVKFEDDKCSFSKDGKDNTCSFSKDGKECDDDLLPTLSFTEYTLQGFSQARPIELPEVGELCLVRDMHDKNWVCEYFIKKIDCFFETKDAYNSHSTWEEIKRIKILD